MQFFDGNIEHFKKINHWIIVIFSSSRDNVLLFLYVIISFIEKYWPQTLRSFIYIDVSTLYNSCSRVRLSNSRIPWVSRIWIGRVIKYDSLLKNMVRKVHLLKHSSKLIGVSHLYLKQYFCYGMSLQYYILLYIHGDPSRIYNLQVQESLFFSVHFFSYVWWIFLF